MENLSGIETGGLMEVTQLSLWFSGTMGLRVAMSLGGWSSGSLGLRVSSSLNIWVSGCLDLWIAGFQDLWVLFRVILPNSRAFHVNDFRKILLFGKEHAMGTVTVTSNFI